MPFCVLLDKLERIDCIGPRVEVYLSRWKLGCSRRMSTRLHNKIDAKEGHAHYR